jgi:general secretion pathway protein F
MSRVLMRWGQFVTNYAAGLVLGFTAIVASLVYGFTRPVVRARIERFIWEMPVVGEQMRLYQLGRFTRTLAMLISGGIPFVTALDMVGGMLQQPALQRGLRQAAQGIREGRMVSDAFALHGLATEVGVRLIAVGERSGEMAQSLEKLAKLYDDEVARWVDWFTRLFEPVLMLGIGLVIGLIVVLMYLPIFELANSLQ